MVFGLFKKKKPAAPPVVEGDNDQEDNDQEDNDQEDNDQEDNDQEDNDERTPRELDGPALALIAQWDEQISTAHQRLQAILAEATVASEQHLTAIVDDFGPLTRLWNVAEHKKGQLTEEISNGWDNWSDQFSELDCVSSEEMDRQGEKRDMGNLALEIAFTRANRQVLARASETMRQKALAQGADGPLYKMFAASGARYLADWQAHDTWEAMVHAEHKIDQYRERRDVPMDLLKQYQASALQYWTITFNTEAEYAPLQRQYVAGKIESYMKHVTKKLREHWQWREQEK